MSRKGATEILKHRIYNDLMIGGTYSNIVAKVRNDDYNVGYTLGKECAKNLVTKVRKTIREDYMEEREHLRETNIARLLDLYNEALKNGDRLTGLKTLQEMNKMVGIYEPQNLNLNLQGEVTIDFGLSNEEKDEKNVDEN